MMEVFLKERIDRQIHDPLESIMYSANIEQRFQVAEFERNTLIKHRNQQRLAAEANADVSQTGSGNRVSVANVCKAFLAKIHFAYQPGRRAAAQ